MVIKLSEVKIIWSMCVCSDVYKMYVAHFKPQSWAVCSLFGELLGQFGTPISLGSSSFRRKFNLRYF